MERYSRDHDLHEHVNTHLVDNKKSCFALVVSPFICFWSCDAFAMISINYNMHAMHVLFGHTW